MSFSYDFTMANDTVKFAYCIPYSYSQLLSSIFKLQNFKIKQTFKSLSGLSIPVLEITDQIVQDYNKTVVLMTARVHPGESNSSYVAEGFIDYLCSKDPTALQLRKMYIFYVIPMLNPDGVIAGNYRTSLFGRDLNRTFDQSRKFAFPETFHLIQLAKQLKQKHKKRFSIYLDLHGHSVKKNIFMYGPDFNIQHSNYESSRLLPKILGNLTSYFRYYSCIFRITGEKSTTARAILNRIIDIPFTYTMQSSNGFYYDSLLRSEVPFTSKKWRQMGMFLCKGLYLWKLENKNKKIHCVYTQKLKRETIEETDQIPIEQKLSDDEISEGKSDSEPSEDDFSEKELNQIQLKVQGKQEESKVLFKDSPQKEIQPQSKSKQLIKQKKYDRRSVYLPPINTLNRAQIFLNRRSNKKEIFQQERLRVVESQLEGGIGIKNEIRSPTKPRYVLSQLVADLRTEVYDKESNRSILFSPTTKRSRYEAIQRLRKLK